MKVTQNTIVGIHYSVVNEAGTVVDSNTDFEPLQYLHGARNLLPALELALEGAIQNEYKHITLEPPLAEEKLLFNVWIKEIRQATAKELLTGRPQRLQDECGPYCNCYIVG